ncbi:hypothetical protein [Chondromyces apiculatus]|uniref:Flagellar hook-length control protein FliK n=1 Tax=Chondromyces apiculatus DSM 436 TaxID=1192034 RepID=A0A017T8Z7_9BACT|nr:hypothetical protein [Chondromyces apiculatus]EYF05714.1 Flagellar hook-length control protein FliK [Chondromyces apiculatus DSM 436]
MSRDLRCPPARAALSRGVALHASPDRPGREDRAGDEEEAPLELPPLDMDEEPEAREDDLADLLDTPGDEGDPFDDTEARDLDVVELDVDPAEGTEGGSEDEKEIDVGPLDEGMSLDEEDGGWAGDEQEGGQHGDDIDDVDAGEDDGGAEGTGEAPEDAVDEGELPALDADDEGNYEGKDLLGELPDLPDDPPPAWDPSPWATVAGAGAEVPCCALAVTGAQVVAGGSVLLVVPAGEQVARRPGLDAMASAVAVADGADGAIVVATQRGRLLRSEDQGVSASPLGGWRTTGGTSAMLATTPGRLWIASEGTLWSLSEGAGAVAPAIAASREGGITGIAASGGALLALWQGKGTAQLMRVRGDDELPVDIALSGAALHVASVRGALIAAGAQGRALALGGAEVLCVSRDGGTSFQVVGGLGRVVALAFAGEEASAPLLALCAREGEAHAELVKVPESGAPTRIAALGEARQSEEDEDLGFGAAALAWDAGREVAWIACQLGLLAVAPKPEH